ncbi:hydrogen peroxide-inducible genes activator [Tateyamaria sp. ANG-S1]|uniref:hydrogen peroxide-inducible genes activator n=1 Tax=Tateyamaria sp. ANG-S1 TaxID=1577905 RepID=UPI00057C4A74|nr:hydrogen peroxide-inducible genes activator [Tateyamaria sp. ANG-S1]KIC50044.1 LysR family transcriptional regulator [Tateyamaria sp. ANG-S1]
MMNITLRQLRYFKALAQDLHFGRAADRCAISQPALSVQIRDLEQTLGLELFERQPRALRLTPKGEDFETRATAILRAMDELGDWATSARGTTLGRLRLGIIPTIAPYLLPNLISQVTQAHPQTDLHVRETVTPRLIDELMDGQLDAAIVALPLDEPALVESPLFSEEMVLIRPKTDATAPPATVNELAQLRLLLLEEGHCFRDQAMSFCNINPNRPRGGLDGSSLGTLVQMVGAGIGVTLIPEMAIDVETRSAPVCISRFAGTAPSRSIGMVWRATNPMGPALQDLVPLVQQAAGHKD